MKRVALTGGGAAAVATGALGQGFPAQADHADLPLAGGRQHRPVPAQARARSPRRTSASRWSIENRPGGSGMNGPATMAKTAQPDGYTISQLAITAFRVPHMQKVDWDPLTDFSYIIGLAGYTFGIVVQGRLAAQDLPGPDRLRAGRIPGKLSYGTPGTGTSLHLAMEEIGAKANVQFLHVPFKG